MNLGEIISHCRSRGAPVLLVDSSALLDVVQAPHRIEVRDLLAAQTIDRAAAASPPCCTVVSSALVASEVARRRSRVEGETATRIKTLGDEFTKLAAFARELGLPMSIEGYDSARSELGKRLGVLSDRLLAGSANLVEDVDAHAAAMQRIAAVKAPCSAGSQSADVHIIENFLLLARRLRRTEFTEPIVFLTSNRRDYCGDGARLHPDLAADFAAASLHFALTFAHAQHELKLNA